MDLATIEKYDSQKMYQIYDNWPKIARESFESNQKPLNLENIEHIVFAGMGGSGAIGDVFASILSKTKIHVNVIKGYDLPPTVVSKTLVVVVSASGNTSEMLSVLNSAYKMNSKIIVFSSGGKIIEYCIKNKIDHRIIPVIQSPRSSFTSYLFTMLNVLQSSLDIKRQDILESIKKLEEINEKINSSNLSKNNPALNLAKWIHGIPIIYYPFGLQSAAIRFKNSLQENVKIHALAEDMMESCHNGIVAWERKSKIQPILIEGQEDHIKTKERWEILKKFLQLNKIEYTEVKSVNGNIISKIICLIYLLDYSTIYKAVLDKIDPTPVKSIEYIKENLENN